MTSSFSGGHPLVIMSWLISRDSRGAPTDLLGITMEDTQTNGDLSIKYG